MFHRVHPMAGRPWLSRSVLPSSLLYTRLNQQLVLSNHPLLSRTVPGTGNTQCSYPRATRHTPGFMQKSLRMSPWGATTRLINRDRDAPSTPYHPPSSRIIAWPLIGKLDGFSTCEIGGAFMKLRATIPTYSRLPDLLSLFHPVSKRYRVWK